MARAGLAFDEARATEAAADRWRPWRSYAQLHIWSLPDQPNKERS
jgi:3-methyladenine DNA glycosylase/8-oxoguanine DNA glycosylase